MDEVHWNNVIYGLRIKFKPVIGSTYYLYKDNGNFILSMIAPWEWKREHVGSFKFEHTGKWIRIPNIP